MSLVPTTAVGPLDRDPQSVVEFLERSKWALDVAVEMTGPAEVALIKAQIVMAETYAKELSLSKDIQEQSKEMVRRAEYALGRAIRRGQEEGNVRPSRGGDTRTDLDRVGFNNPVSPTDFSTSDELYGNGAGIMHLADADSEKFEDALADAKAEQNLSRANVVRKIKGQQHSQGLTRQQRADLIADLAAQGYSSRQMTEKVGVRDDRVRQIARDFDIDIPADRVVGRSRRIDHTDVVEKTVTDLENTAEFIQAHVDLSQVDFSEADEWVSSLTKSISALTRFRNQIKEKTHV